MIHSKIRMRRECYVNEFRGNSGGRCAVDNNKLHAYCIIAQQLRALDSRFSSDYEAFTKRRIRVRPQSSTIDLRRARAHVESRTNRRTGFLKIRARDTASTVIRAIRRGRDKCEQRCCSLVRRPFRARIVSRSPGLSVVTFERIRIHLSKCIRASCHFLVASIPDRSAIIDISALFSPAAVKSRDKITPIFPRRLSLSLSSV